MTTLSNWYDEILLPGQRSVIPVDDGALVEDHTPLLNAMDAATVHGQRTLIDPLYFNVSTAAFEPFTGSVPTHLLPRRKYVSSYRVSYTANGIAVSVPGYYYIWWSCSFINQAGLTTTQFEICPHVAGVQVLTGCGAKFWVLQVGQAEVACGYGVAHMLIGQEFDLRYNAPDISTFNIIPAYSFGLRRFSS